MAGWLAVEGETGLCPSKPGAIKMLPLCRTVIHFLTEVRERKKEKKTLLYLDHNNLLTLLEAHHNGCHVELAAVGDDICAHLLSCYPTEEPAVLNTQFCLFCVGSSMVDNVRQS